MALRIAWSQPAVHDLEAISAFIAEDSPAYASTVIRNLVHRTRNLAKFPRSGRRVPEFDDENIREVIVYGYRLIYHLQIETVLIVAVIHGKRILR